MMSSPDVFSELGRAAQQPPSLSSRGDNVVGERQTEECNDKNAINEDMYMLPPKRKYDNNDNNTLKRNYSKKGANPKNYQTLCINQTFNNRYQQSSFHSTSNKTNPSSKVNYNTQPDINDTDSFPSLSEPKPFINDFPPWQVLSAIHISENPDQQEDPYPDNFKYINMFNLVKELKKKINIVFDDGDIKRLFNGNIVFKIHTKEQYQMVKKIREIMGIPCTITPHKFLNSSKGVVYSPYFKAQTAESLQESLASEGILDVKKIIIFRKITKQSDENDMDTDQSTSKTTYKQIDTGKAILTFDNINRPDKVWLGFCYAKVEMYIPPPLRCNKCQGFGHHSMACKNKQFCAKCNSQDHVDTKMNKCPSTFLKCHNCHGKHASFSSECIHYKKAKEITSIKHKSNITWKEAITRVENDKQWTNIKPINYNPKQTASVPGADLAAHSAAPAAHPAALSATDTVAENTPLSPSHTPSTTSSPSFTPSSSPPSTSSPSTSSTSSSFSTPFSIPSSQSFTSSPSNPTSNTPPSSIPPSNPSTIPSSNSSSSTMIRSKSTDRKLSKDHIDSNRHPKNNKDKIKIITPPK